MLEARQPSAPASSLPSLFHIFAEKELAAVASQSKQRIFVKPDWARSSARRYPRRTLAFESLGEISVKGPMRAVLKDLDASGTNKPFAFKYSLAEATVHT